MPDKQIDDLYDQFRTLSLQKPRQAREFFCELLDNDSPLLLRLVERVSQPSEGRLRQLIANAVRPRSDKTQIAPHLVQWLGTETDEFARSAIKAALEGINLKMFKVEPLHDLPNFLTTYRYVTERACHRVRNGLTAPHNDVRALREAISLLEDARIRGEFETIASRLQQSLRRVSHIVGFDEDDAYFSIRPIALCSWIEDMTKQYSQTWQPLSIRFEGSNTCKGAKIMACDYLLETAFWNIWKNTQQEVGDNCVIIIRTAVAEASISLILLDTGNGFPADAQHFIFQEQYSTNGPMRGKGLLEVRDAVERLHGKAELIAVNQNEHRIRLTFPLGEQ
jgi:signal transduction histidine kinase